MSKSSAQSNLSQEQLAAVMSVLTQFLFDGLLPAIPEPAGERVDIDLDELDPNSYQVSDAFYVAFNPQSETTEFCFDLASNIPLQPGDIVVQINGEDVDFELGADNCFVFNSANYAEINYVYIAVNNPSITLTIDRIELAGVNQSQLLLPKVTRGGWDEDAVRKVLKVFAFGGQALDAQISVWADMDASQAITEMLNFSEHNLKLSARTPCDANTPCESYTEVETSHGTLREFVGFLSSESSNLPIPSDERSPFGIDSYRFEQSFSRMATVRGLNPFRQRIGFWETNYHLAVNLDADVDRDQVTEYYDVIMAAHESGVPYHEVLGVAAKSAAAAIQYGHFANQWNPFTLECDCNDDFAREIHQLYYGIFGVDDPNHEDVTIPETAKMLTDMRVGEDGAPDNIVVFETEFHHTDPVMIFGDNVSGADASDKIEALMPRSIMHPEALNNLPVMIISVLADDALTESKRQQLRASWASMGANKYFLDFIHAYAISTLFHSPDQIKYFSSFERAIYKANKYNLDNLEAFFGGDNHNGIAGYDIEHFIERELAGRVFRPINNVFGGQTSLAASDSSAVFENNFNTITTQGYRFRNSVDCSTCDNGSAWEKKWQAFLPKRSDDEFYVEDAAAWLWNHVVGSMRDYTELERAHLVSILGFVRKSPNQNNDQSQFLDFNLFMCVVEDYLLQESESTVTANYLMTNGRWDNYCRVNNGDSTTYTPEELTLLNKAYSASEIEQNNLIQQLLDELGEETLPLLTTTGANGGADLREHARERIQAAIAFIFTTPYVFAEAY